MIRTLTSAALAVVLLSSTAVYAADHHGPRMGHDGYRGGAFGGGERFAAPAFRDFRGDRDAWRGGRWRHEWHDGRLGWWWVVGDFWGFYPEPIYPYPAYAYDDAPPPPVAGGTWYYCAHPQGYYPCVRNCDAAWQPVPAQPQP